MRTLVLLTTLTLIGCTPSPEEVAAIERANAINRAPAEHVCTPEQSARVEHEASWCDKNTSYYSSYCYASAIIRNCTRRAGVTSNVSRQEEGK